MQKITLRYFKFLIVNIKNALSSVYFIHAITADKIVFNTSNAIIYYKTKLLYRDLKLFNLFSKQAAARYTHSSVQQSCVWQLRTDI